MAWRGVDQSIFDRPSGLAQLVPVIKRTFRSSVHYITRLTKVYWAAAISTFLVLVETIRANLFAASQTSRVVSEVVTMQLWTIGDAVRAFARKLRDKATTAGRVIRLGEQRAGSLQWNLVINLNFHSSPQKPVGSTWIDKPLSSAM